MASYAPPAWSAPPAGRYALEVVRDGAVVESLDVSARPHYVLGRHASTADLVIEHPSVSRQHAVLQHRQSGEVYIMDLGSTHGTFLNKKRLAPHMYVPLRLGSMIKLGGSSRSLILLGDTEPHFDPTAADAQPVREGPDMVQLAARQEKLARRTGKSMISAEDLHSSGAGWGFSADAYELQEADNDALDQLSFESLYEQAKSKGLNMTARQTRLVEQLEKRVAKLDHLSAENDRITAKEIEGLSDGQRAHLERNEKRIKELGDEVSSLKESIADSIREQLGTKKAIESKSAPKRRREEEDGDSDDDFYDRTARKMSKGKRPEQATETVDSDESLRAKLTILLAEKDALTKKEEALLAEAVAAETETHADPLEAFMSANSTQVRHGRLVELRARLVTLASEESRLQKLIQFVQPAINPVLAAPAASPSSSETASAAGKATMAASPAEVHAQGVHKETKRSSPYPIGGMASALESMRQAEPNDKAEVPTVPPADEPPPAKPDLPASAPMSAADAFRMEFVAALNRLGKHDESETSLERDGRAIEEAEGQVKTAGLGYGAQAPDTGQLEKIKKTLADEKQKSASQNASLQPGLNRNSAGHDTKETKERRPIGPAMPPPGAMAPPIARSSKKVAPVTKANEQQFEWQPPSNQSGDGKTALNQKLGY